MGEADNGLNAIDKYDELKPDPGYHGHNHAGDGRDNRS